MVVNCQGSDTNRDIALNHTLHVQEQVLEFTREQPDWERSAMPRNDPRNIYWETMRPLFSCDDVFVNNELHPDLQAVLPQDVIDKILRFTPAQWVKFLELIAKCNATVWNVAPLAVHASAVTQMLHFLVPLNKQEQHCITSSRTLSRMLYLMYMLWY